jgi:RIO kinase 2
MSDQKGPYFKDARKLVGKDGVKRLDVSVEASGFSKKMAKELEAYMKEVGVDGDGDPNAARGDEDSDDEEENDDDGLEENGDAEEGLGENKSHVDERNSAGAASISQLRISDKT